MKGEQKARAAKNVIAKKGGVVQIVSGLSTSARNSVSTKEKKNGAFGAC